MKPETATEAGLGQQSGESWPVESASRRKRSGGAAARQGGGAAAEQAAAGAEAQPHDGADSRAEPHAYSHGHHGAPHRGARTGLASAKRWCPPPEVGYSQISSSSRNPLTKEPTNEQTIE